MHALELLFIVALILYSLVIWSHKFKKKLSVWMVVLFGIALSADVSGTIFLCAAAAIKWRWNLHTISGLASILIMALHFIWAYLALRSKGVFERYFNYFSIWAWCLWVVSFISGIPM